MKKNWWNILITVFVFKHHRGGTKFWIQYMNWSMFLPRNKRILKNKLKNQIFLIVKGGANWSANWQCWISISKAPGALIRANTVTIVETSGWRHLKRKISSFLSVSIQKCIIPAQKLHNLRKLPQTKNGKLYFSRTFQKVELRNSTFFQLEDWWEKKTTF